MKYISKYTMDLRCQKITKQKYEVKNTIEQSYGAYSLYAAPIKKYEYISESGAKMIINENDLFCTHKPFFYPEVYILCLEDENTNIEENEKRIKNIFLHYLENKKADAERNYQDALKTYEDECDHINHMKNEMFAFFDKENLTRKFSGKYIYSVDAQNLDNGIKKHCVTNIIPHFDINKITFISNGSFICCYDHINTEIPIEDNYYFSSEEKANEFIKRTLEKENEQDI